MSRVKESIRRRKKDEKSEVMYGKEEKKGVGGN